MINNGFELKYPNDITQKLDNNDITEKIDNNEENNREEVMEIEMKTKEEVVQDSNISVEAMVEDNEEKCWANIPYYNETKLPVGVDPKAGSWPLYYFVKEEDGSFYNIEGEKVDLAIKNPEEIDYHSELAEVIEVQKCLINQCDQIKKDTAIYWGTGIPINQWTPIALKLVTAYKVTPPDSGRIMSSLHCGINDGFVIGWYYKYLYCMPRPCQLYHNLKTILNTPKFPSYPSGHSIISGVCEMILGYYFPNEKETLKKLAEEASISRLYGGIHFVSDLTQGLSLGRRIGEIIVETLKRQGDCQYMPVDTIYYNCVYTNNILPPYYPCK